MRLPRMSTGAWIFATAVTVAAIAAPVSYAAVSSTVAIGNAGNNYTATVDAEHQLLAVPVAPHSVVYGRFNAGAAGSCVTGYTPPTGKAVVLTSVTYTTIDTPASTETDALLTDCSYTGAQDSWENPSGDATVQHTFPVGFPMRSVGLYNRLSNDGGILQVAWTGYLIPASHLPAAQVGVHSLTLQHRKP